MTCQLLDHRREFAQAQHYFDMGKSSQQLYALLPQPVTLVFLADFCPDLGALFQQVQSHRLVGQLQYCLQGFFKSSVFVGREVGFQHSCFPVSAMEPE